MFLFNNRLFNAYIGLLDLEMAARILNMNKIFLITITFEWEITVLSLDF